MSTIDIAKDFSSTPGGRFRSMGPKSGEEFRDLLLSTLERTHGKVIVVLDGVEGYGSSFLEEAFGGLVRLRRWPTTQLLARIELVARDPTYATYVREVRQYLQEAASRLDA